jgi:kynurenine formamidase
MQIHHVILVFGLGGIVASAARGQPAVDLTRYRLVDLTHALNERTVFWPTSPTRFKLEQLSYGPTPGGWFYSAYSFSTPEHGGTHLDAPSHFSRTGHTTDQVPLEQLIAPAVVIDIATQAASNPDYQLTREDVVAWERANGTIPPGSIVLLRTGWSKRWPNAKSYLGDDTPGDVSKLHFPSFGEVAARYLVTDRRVAALGVDGASIDHGASKDFKVHQVTAGANVVGLENLTNLDQLPLKGATLIALPMKIEKGSGGPLRAVALVPRR